MILGQYYSQLRKESGLDLRTLGNAIGISPSAIQKIESGVTPNPTFLTLFLIGRELKADPVFLFKIIQKYDPVVPINTDKYISDSIATEFDQEYQRNPEKGSELFVKWINKTYKNFSGDYYKQSTDYYIRLADTLVFTKSQVDFFISGQNYFFFSLGYPIDCGQFAILDVYYNNGLILKEDIAAYCRLRKEAREESYNKKPLPSVLINKFDNNFPFRKRKSSLNSKEDVALTKFRNNPFPAQIYLTDILTLDSAFADHGEIFMMSWQLSESFLKWDYFRAREIIRNLVFLDRWVTTYCFNEREEWIDDIKEFITKQ